MTALNAILARYRTRQFLHDFFVGLFGGLALGAAILIAAVIFTKDANAAEPARGATVAAYMAADEHCRGDQYMVEPAQYPACRQRDAMRNKLLAQGYVQGEASTNWYTPQQRQAVLTAVTGMKLYIENGTYDAQWLMTDAYKTMLGMGATNASIVEVWAQVQGQVQMLDPNVYALMSEAVHTIIGMERKRKNNDVAFDYDF
jgi:hypothetical protein